MFSLYEMICARLEDKNVFPEELTRELVVLNQILREMNVGLNRDFKGVRVMNKDGDEVYEITSLSLERFSLMKVENPVRLETTLYPIERAFDFVLA